MSFLDWSINVAWRLGGASLAIGLACVAAWYFFRVRHRRLRLPGFFLIAVAIHAFLVAGSFYIYLDPGAVPQIQRQFQRLVVRGQMSLESMPRLFKPSAEPFQQVADLKSKQTENLSAGVSTALPLDPPPPDAPLTLEPLPLRSLAPGLAAPPNEVVAILDLQQPPRRRAEIALESDAIEIDAPRAAPQPAETQFTGVAVSLDRRGTAAEPAVTSGIAPGPIAISAMPASKLAVGPVQDPAASVTLSQISLSDVSPLPRRPARSPLLTDDGEKIGLQAMFSHRQGEMKREAIEAFGGSPQTLAAVRRGLEWIEKGQHKDGYWSFERIYRQGREEYYPGRGSEHSDSAATGLGLLPFLANGHTHISGEHRATVRNGIDWLVKHQKADGDLSFQTDGNSQMYAHAIAAIALCEVFGMSKDLDLQTPAQRAIEFVVKAQTQDLGGWRYHPNQDSDTSVVGWEVMALKSGQMAGLNVPQAALDRVHHWLDKVEGKGQSIGTFCYQPGREITPEMTAEGLLCSQYLGADRNSPRLRAGAEYLLQHLPKKDQQSSYYWYYGTQVMYHMQGDSWRAWNAALRDHLLQTQLKDGVLAGTWEPRDQWESRGGRLYATSLRLLMLSVYYRHLPLYQSLER